MLRIPELMAMEQGGLQPANVIMQVWNKAIIRARHCTSKRTYLSAKNQVSYSKNALQFKAILTRWTMNFTSMPQRFKAYETHRSIVAIVGT